MSSQIYSKGVSRIKKIKSVPSAVHNISVSIAELVETVRRLEQKQDQSFLKLSNDINNSGTYKISETEIIVKIFTGAKMVLDPRDIALVPHIVIDHEWERNISNAWLTVAKQKDIVIDIGANFGYFGLLAAQQTQRNCHVVLFEANPELIPYISKTMDMNAFNKCSKVENFAVSNSAGELVLNVLEDHAASSSIHDIDEINSYNYEKMKLSSQVKVPAISLDAYCKDNKISAVNLIKMDIEGYEDVAYEGMKNIVAKSPNLTLFVEFTKKGYKSPKTFYNKMLKDFGNVYIIDDSGALSKPSDNSYASVISENAEWVMPVFSKNNNLDKIII